MQCHLVHLQFCLYKFISQRYSRVVVVSTHSMTGLQILLMQCYNYLGSQVSLWSPVYQSKPSDSVVFLRHCALYKFIYLLIIYLNNNVVVSLVIWITQLK